MAVVLPVGAHVLAHCCGDLSERYAGKGSSVGVAMPKAVRGESRIGFDQSSPIGMAIEVLPEGVPTGFEVLGVQDPDWQLDQPAAELSKSLTCSTCEFWNLQWVGDAIGFGTLCRGPVALDVADLELPVLHPHCFQLRWT